MGLSRDPACEIGVFLLYRLMCSDRQHVTTYLTLREAIIPSILKELGKILVRAEILGSFWTIQVLLGPPGVFRLAL